MTVFQWKGWLEKCGLGGDSKLENTGEPTCADTNPTIALRSSAYAFETKAVANVTTSWPCRQNQRRKDNTQPLCRGMGWAGTKTKLKIRRRLEIFF